MKNICVISLMALFITASAVPAFAGAKGLKKDAGGYFFLKKIMVSVQRMSGCMLGVMAVGIGIICRTIRIL